MYGMLYSIKNFVNKMSPIDVKEGFQCYRTSKYVLNYFETPSGVKFVMNTDLHSQGVRELLQQINSQVNFHFNCYVYYFFKSLFHVYFLGPIFTYLSRFILNIAWRILPINQEKPSSVNCLKQNWMSLSSNLPYSKAEILLFDKNVNLVWINRFISYIKMILWVSFLSLTSNTRKYWGIQLGIRLLHDRRDQPLGLCTMSNGVGVWAV